MTLRRISPAQLSVLCRLLLGLAFWLIAEGSSLAQPPAEAVAAFHREAASLVTRLLHQHQSAAAFLPTVPQQLLRLHRGDLIIEQLSPAAQPDGALLHHWRATAFVPGATAAQFEQMLRDFRAYPHLFAPQVLAARAQPVSRDTVQAVIRVRQKHVIAVVLDTSYDVSFGQLDAHDRFSTSRSTRIEEIDAPGTGHERALSPADEHGFLWRLNTYWTYQQRDDGLYLQIESVSLSRSIPTGLGWALRPYVTSVPRESLEFTLRSALTGLRPPINALHP